MAEASICAICQESNTKGKVLLTTACQHVFHYDCIMMNVKMNDNGCPLCRKPIQHRFNPLPTLTNNLDDDQWNCPSCTYLNSSSFNLCSICKQERHQPIKTKDYRFQDKKDSFYSISSLQNQLSCNNFLCHSKDPTSNILCDTCLSNSESQQTMAKCQVDSHSQSESLINDAKQWVCSVCTYSNEESSRRCNMCRQGLRSRPLGGSSQSGEPQSTRQESHLSSSVNVSQKFKQIVEELRSNTAYRDLSLAYKKITSDDMNIILESLKFNTTVTKLTLSGCRLTDNHLQLLGEILKRNKTLNDLTLSSSDISDTGIAIFADALKYNHTITSLYLSNNIIGDSGAMAIANALKCNRKLANLYLCSNNIGDAGGTAIADALSVNNTLCTLHMTHNQLSGIIKTMIEDTFAQNRSNSYSFVHL